MEVTCNSHGACCVCQSWTHLIVAQHAARQRFRKDLLFFGLRPHGVARAADQVQRLRGNPIAPRVGGLVSPRVGCGFIGFLKSGSGVLVPKVSRTLYHCSSIPIPSTLVPRAWGYRESAENPTRLPSPKAVPAPICPETIAQNTPNRAKVQAEISLFLRSFAIIPVPGKNLSLEPEAVKAQASSPDRKNNLLRG